MIKVYLKAKTFEQLIVKQEMMNTLGGREYQFQESFYAKGFFYITFKDSIDRWARVSAEIEKRFKEKVKEQTKEKVAK